MHANEMAVFGIAAPEERVYRHFLRNPNTTASSLVPLLGLEREAVDAILTRLLRLRLLRPGDRPERLLPADPETAVARLTELRLHDMYREIQRITHSRDIVAELYAESEARPQSQSDTGTGSGASPGTGAGGGGGGGGEPGVEELDDREEIRSRLEDLAFFARREIVSVEPSIDLMFEQISHAQAFEWHALRRGVRRRMVVPRAALRHPPVTGYLSELMSRGGRVRVATEMADQVVVFDGRTALMPQDPGNVERGVLLVRGKALVGSLAGLFERVWDQAEDVGVELRDPAEERSAGMSDAELRVLKLMCSVAKDETGARDLGVSVRTYRRHIADLMRRLGASTRAQAALLARERGWI